MSKLQRYIVAAVITAVVVFLVWYFSNVVTYILIAAVLAIIGKPLTDLLTGLHLGRSKIRIPKAVAALLTLIVIWLVVVGLFWLFVPILFQKLNQFSSLNISQIVASFQGPLVSLEHMIEKVFSIPDNEFSLADAIAGQIRPLLNINLINNLLSSIVGTIGSLLIGDFFYFVHHLFLPQGEHSLLRHGDHHVSEKIRTKHLPCARFGDQPADSLLYRNRLRVRNHDGAGDGRPADFRLFVA